ncbi:hypothetical protein HN385_04015 [archaeon]|jgi:hypothetical protein|nr:hypothetical protein [archaeon]MBT3450915.1 hypothetical protein [archaeon]MBT6869097.1 hypothetical protein [archaeon]MBT7193340.1 hypothetical protein [archaeon]MBT7380348.1 hypothetical protein [archaeon]
MAILQAYELRRDEIKQESNLFTTLYNAKSLPNEQYMDLIESLDELPEPSQETNLVSRVGSTLYELLHPVESIKLICLKESLDSVWCDDELYNN